MIGEQRNQINMQKTDGHLEWEKQKSANFKLESVDFDEKKYSYKDMQSVEGKGEFEKMTIGLIAIFSLVFILIVFLLSH